MAIFSLIIAGLGAAGFTGAITILGLSPALSAAFISVGKSILWNAFAKVVGPKVPKQQVQASIAQAIAPRVRGYGVYRLGGVKAFREAKDKVLHQITVAHHTPISGIEYFEVNGERVTLDGGLSGQVTSGDANGCIWIYSILSGDGGDYAAVRSVFPTMWTTNHKLTNQATYYVEMKAPKPEKMYKRFPRGAETSVTMVARLSEVLDPRDMSFGYTNLTGPVALDYLTHEDGYRIPIGSIDLDSFSSFTDVCDEDVTLKAGGTEKRYRVGGYYTLEDAPKDVITRILETADAQMYMTTEGKVGILGGRWHDPDVTISWEDILSIDIEDAFDEFTAFNTLKGKFTSPLHRFQDTEVDELLDETALLTQPERVDTHDVEMCPSPSQLRRLMYLYRARKIRRFTGTMRTNLVGMKARFPRGDGPHVINVYYPELDINMVFEVTSHNYSTVGKYCDISIATLDNAYPWDPATQEGDPPPPLSDLNTPSVETFTPTGLILTQVIVVLASGQNGVKIDAGVDDPGIDGVQLYLEYRKVGDILWSPMVVGIGELEGSSGLVDTNTTYEVRASWVGENTHTTTSSITVVSTPTPSILFTAGELGAWYDPSDVTTLFQDSAGTIPVTASGQPVGRMLDKSGNGHHALQATAGKCPIYTVAGGLSYLVFDGVDDCMTVAAIDFTSVDSMSVFAGFKRLSNAARGNIVEFGVTGAEAGIFTLSDPLSATQGWFFRSRGTSGATAQQATIDSAPRISVLTGISDISSDICQLRRNGALLYNITTNQGTGNFNNLALNIGSRDGASIFLNGDLYGLIVRAKVPTAYETTAVETWMNVKTGAY